MPGHVPKRTARFVSTLITYHLPILSDFSLGIVTSSDTAAFDGAAIDRFSMSRSTITCCTIEGNDVYVAYDPCGGGASAAAIVMGFVDTVTRQFVICGANAKQLSSDGAQESFIKSNIQELRALPAMGNTRIIGIIESNFGGNVGASRIGNILGEFTPVRIMTGDSTNARRAGVITTDVVKERCVFVLLRLLS